MDTYISRDNNDNPGKYININGSVEVLDCTAHLLKIAMRKVNPPIGSRRTFVYHSWRAVIHGQDQPLDELELEVFQNRCPIDLFLVGNDSHVEVINSLYNKPAIVLPYTAFIPENPFRYRQTIKDFDVVFFCMFNQEQFERKNAQLFLDILRADPSLRALWIGDYNFYDRWCMEEGFNNFFNQSSPPPEEWLPLWTEAERSVCWYGGSKISSFLPEAEKLREFENCVREIRRENLNITFYRGLARNQVAHILNRSKCAIVLSERDQWPRCIMESLACGLPVVAANHLLSGLQVLDRTNSFIAEPDPIKLSQAIRQSYSFSQEQISRSFHEKYGLENSCMALIRALDEIGINWSEVLDWQRPAETILKKEIREVIRITA